MIWMIPGVILVMLFFYSSFKSQLELDEQVDKTCSSLIAHNKEKIQIISPEVVSTAFKSKPEASKREKFENASYNETKASINRTIERKIESTPTKTEVFVSMDWCEPANFHYYKHGLESCTYTTKQRTKINHSKNYGYVRERNQQKKYLQNAINNINIYFYSDYIYHYTTLENARLILRDRIIYRSKARIAIFGEGVFLTLMDPSSSNHDLIKNNYRGNYKYISKVECAVALKRSDIRAIQFWDELDPTRDLWRSIENIDLRHVRFQVYDRVSA